MTPEDIKRTASGTLVEQLGIEWEYVRQGETSAYISIQPHHLAPNGYLHGGTVVALADTCCGFGCLASLPAEAESFTTVELKTNFLGTATQGVVSCVATMTHGGRATQVWDAVISNAQGKEIALFRCTQFVIYPR